MQVLKSGTSIGALVREAEFGQSKADFISKMSIALKEANETDYWISILYHTEYLEEKMHQSLASDCKEILAILITAVKTANSLLKNCFIPNKLIPRPLLLKREGAKIVQIGEVPLFLREGFRVSSTESRVFQQTAKERNAIKPKRKTKSEK